MDAYNQKILNPSEKDPIGERLHWHWNIEPSVAEKCSACGQCEKACTQHLDIIERLKEIAHPMDAMSPSDSGAVDS
jgi:predicted aldo/keto reductase-like oxidoreductase